MHYLTSIFLTLLIFLDGENFVVAKNQATSAPLGDLCALAVNSSSTRTTTGPVAAIIPSQTQSFTVNDRLTTDTYDANGNTLVSKEGGTGVPPVSSSSVTDVYSFDNRLIRRTTPDGKTIDLTHNPDGHRLTKFITQNGLTQRLVHYLTDANNPTGYAQVIEEKHPLEAAGSQLKKVNLYGHDLICSVGLQPSSSSFSPLPHPTSLLYYNYDGLGSVRSISNSTGDLTETYDYDAYGTLIGLAKRNASTGVLESTLITDHSALITQSEYLFAGEQFDSDLHMYFLRARYLNTNTGRFHTQDTYEGRNGEPITLHKYLYANGNPAMFTDPSGMMGLGELSVVLSFYSASSLMTDTARVCSLLGPIGSGLIKVGAALARDYLNARGYYENKYTINFINYNIYPGPLDPIQKTYLFVRFREALNITRIGIILNTSAGIGSRVVSLRATKEFTQEAQETLDYLTYTRISYSVYNTYKYKLPEIWTGASSGIATSGDIADIHLMLIDFRKWID